MSLRDLESQLGNRVSAQAIGKYERGEMSPSSEVLELLAQTLRVPVAYLVHGSEVKLEGVEFRKKAVATQKEQAQLEAIVLEHVERYLTLEALLSNAGPGWDRPPRGFPFTVTSLADAELAAVQLRQQWNIGTDPVLGLSEFLEERGIKILSLDLPHPFSGLMGWIRLREKPNVPTIVIGKNDTGERQRFTLAHELAHILLNVEAPGINAESVANRFAGAFLVPSEIMWEEIGRHRRTLSVEELVLLKPFVGVSLQVLAYRCLELNIISRSMFDRLFEEFRARNWMERPYREPYPVPAERPSRFTRLCYRAYTENIITGSQLAELFGLSEAKLKLIGEQLLSS